MTTGEWHNRVCGEAQPQSVLHYFEEICAIPHGSWHTQEISDYLVRFAKEHGLHSIQDEAGNVIITKPASAGLSVREPVILQGHMDMVLEQTQECTRDLEKEPIVLRRDGDLLYAEGTTLGGDDGIAVAMMLALLDDDSIVHPPLECIFTVNEEVGLLGASVLDVSTIRGRRMINIDSEAEGVFIVGCAGGTEQHAVFPVSRKVRFGSTLCVELSGLTGGHSGICIQEGRGNAALLLGRVLYHLYQDTPFRMVSIDGGTKDNAIPRDARARLLFDEERCDRAAVMKSLHQCAKRIQAEYSRTDPGMKWSFQWEDRGELAASTLSKSDTKKILRFLMLTPNGLLETDAEDHSLLQTSLNLGILRTEESEIRMVFLIRSSINSQKKYVTQKVALLTRLLDGRSETVGTYPAWERKTDSPLCAQLADIYTRQKGTPPRIEVIHGGVECGVLAAKLDGLDCVSIGPDMVGIHTPDERLSISSVQRVWEFLLAALREL